MLISAHSASVLVEVTNVSNVNPVLTCRGVLKYQTNVEAHPPGCLRANQSSAKQEELESAEDEERRCREEALFLPHYPQVCVRALFVCR